MLPGDPWVDALKGRSDVETFLLTFQNRKSMTEMMAMYLGKVIDVSCQRYVGSG